MTRLRWIALTFSLFLLIYVGRLADLQILRHNSYSTASENNYLRDEVIRALRGQIYTRDGVLLASSKQVTDLMYSGGDILFWEKIRYLAKIKDPKLPQVPPGGEITLVRDVPTSVLPALREWTVMQPNLELRQRLQRIYPKSHLAGNLIGYTAEASPESIKNGEFASGDMVGQSGIEASMDGILRGENGTQRIEVDPAGRWVRDREHRDGKAGKDVVLTIDSRLQAAAEKALLEGLDAVNRGRYRHGLPPETEARGAIVVINPRNSEVLALATAPTLNPNWFSMSPRPPQLVAALRGDSGSLVNRAVQAYPPGSVFKPTSTNAFIEKYGNRTYVCVPGINFGGYYKKNWSRYNMGPMDDRGAIAQSCNTWYYQAALDVGTDDFGNVVAKRARELGYGKPTGIELLGERSGLVTSPEEYKKDNMTWYPGFSLNFGIGQGDLTATPTQVAYSLTTLINKGKQRPLTILRKVGGHVQAPKAVNQLSGQAKNWQTILEGMQATVQYGTATTLLGGNRFAVPTGGKTGTAQAGRHPKAPRSLGTAGYEHSWYEGYGPINNPQIAVVAFFEHGGEGSDVALPATKKVMAAYWGYTTDKGANITGTTPPIEKPFPVVPKKNKPTPF